MALMLLDNNNSGGFRTTGTNGRFAASALPTSVVSNGLVLYLDAGKTASYSGTGSTWNDLSGNNNHATLVNSPTFSSASGGELIFNGSNQYGTVSSTSFPFGSNASTISIWAKLAAFGVGHTWLFNYGTTANQQNRMTGHYGPGKNYHAGTWGYGLNVGGVTLNKWFNLSYVYSGALEMVYINGTLIGINSVAYNTTLNDGIATIGRQILNSGYTDYWNGSIASIAVYNRALGQSEILQNYDARWGSNAILL